ncbi:MAG: DUF1631 family protein [Burkholderiaceae bacterium]
MEFKLDPGRAPAEITPISGSQSAALLRSGLAIGCELLGEGFSALVKGVAAELGSRRDFDRRLPLVQHLLERRADELRTSFLVRLNQAQDESYAALIAAAQRPLPAHARPEFDPETLSLVDAFAIDSTAVLEKNAHQLAGQLDPAMGELNLVVGHIAGRSALKTAANPLGPFVVVKALLEAAEDQNLDPEAWPLLLAAFERPLARAIEPVLTALLEHFARHGVGVRAVRRALVAARPASAPRSDNGPNTAGLSPNSRLGNSQFGNSQFGHSQFGNSQFDNSQFGNSHLGNSQFGNSQFGHTQTGASGAPGGGEPESRAAATEALNQIVARLQFNARGTRMPAMPPAGPPAQELMQSLEELQKLNLQAEGGGRMALAATGSINTWREQLVGNTDRTVDKLTIEIVGMLFDHVMSDPQVPAEIKARISRLQFPVLKAALIDAAFFASSAHPARKLIDRIAGTAAGWEPYGDDNQRYLRELDRVVHEVLELFSGDAAVFERLFLEFDAFVSDVNPADRDPVSRAKQALEAAEKQEILTINTTIQVRRAFERIDLEPHIRDFLLGPWVRVMVAASIRADAQPGFAKSFRDVINDIVWSVQPKASADDRSRLVKTIPTMIRILRDGLALIHFPDREREVFFSQLMESHAMAVKPVDQAAYIKASLATTELRAKIDGMQMSGLFAATSVPGGIRISTQAIAAAAQQFQAEIEMPADLSEIGHLDPLEEAKITEAVARWQCGHWFKLWNGVDFVRARLRWMSPLRTIFLFASGQESRPHALSATQVRSYVARGHLEPLEQIALTQRAVDAVVADFEHAPGRAADLAARYATAA